MLDNRYPKERPAPLIVNPYNAWVSLYWLMTGQTVGRMQLHAEANCLDWRKR